MTHINLTEVATEIADEKGPSASGSRQRPFTHVRRKNKRKNVAANDHEELNSLLSENDPTQPVEMNTFTQTADTPVQSDPQQAKPDEQEQVTQPIEETVTLDPVQSVETQVSENPQADESSQEQISEPKETDQNEKLKAFAELLKNEQDKDVKFNTGEDVLSFIGQRTWKSVYSNFKGLFISDAIPEGIIFNFLDALKDGGRTDYVRSHTLKSLMSTLSCQLKNVNLRKDNKVYFFEIIDFIGRGYCEFIIDYSKDEPTVCIGWSDEYRHINVMLNNDVKRYKDTSIDFLLQAMDFALRRQMNDLIELSLRK